MATMAQVRGPLPTGNRPRMRRPHDTPHVTSPAVMRNPSRPSCATDRSTQATLASPSGFTHVSRDGDGGAPGRRAVDGRDQRDRGARRSRRRGAPPSAPRWRRRASGIGHGRRGGATPDHRAGRRAESPGGGGGGAPPSETGGGGGHRRRARPRRSFMNCTEFCPALPHTCARVLRRTRPSCPEALGAAPREVGHGTAHRYS